MTPAEHRAWIKPIVAPFLPVVRELLLTSLVVNTLALVTPIFSMQVYDRVLGHNSYSTLIGLSIGAFLVLVFDFVLRISRSRIMQTVALKLDVEVGHRLFQKFTMLPLRALEARPASFWQQLFRDVDTVRNTISGATALLLTDLPFLVLFLAVIYVIGRPLLIIFFVLLVAYIVLAWYSGKKLSGSGSEESKVVASRDALVAELIAGRSVVKATGLSRAFTGIWEERQAISIEHSIRRGATADGFSTIGQELTQFGSVGMTSLGALFILNHDLSMGALVACNMLSGRLYGPIGQLVGAWRTYGGFVQAVDRLGQVFSMPEDRSQSAVSLSRPKGAISIEGISFAFEPGRAPVVVVDHLGIAPGGITAILGRNGSGKTTLLKIIQGLYKPDKGRVVLDGADIVQFSRGELCHWIGYVPQECLLFAGTVRDNIAWGAPGCSDEALLAAATSAGVHQAVIDMPDGYATPIGEAGSRLSAGQRQRIAIARALVGDPAVLLLDEPSSSLDRQAEEELRDTLARLAKDRTVIVVTHSPVLLPACRDLIVLEKGHVAAAGPAQEILPRLLGPRPATAAPTAIASGPATGSAP